MADVWPLVHAERAASMYSPAPPGYALAVSVGLTWASNAVGGGTVAFSLTSQVSTARPCVRTGLPDPCSAPMVVVVSDHAMSATQAADLAVGLGEAGVQAWVIGGWGIDALVGGQTRDHHDLDLLVRIDDLPVLEDWLRHNGFARLHVWDENQAVRVDGATFDTAFVARHADGRELDVHGITVDADGCPQLGTMDPWELPFDALSGAGFLDGRPVPCVTRIAQVLMHRGYELPQNHRDDLVLLERMSRDDG